MNCLNCQNETNNPKFCCNSCAAKYNNANFPRTNGLKYTKISFCVDCSILVKGHKKRCAVCSTVFKSNLRRNLNSGEKFQNQCINAGKSSARTRNKRSIDEIKLFDLISTKFTAIPNHVIKDGWDADIFIPSLNTAIFWNGPWHYKEMGINGHSLKQVQNRDKIKTSLFESIGIKVYAFEDRHFTPQTAYEALLAQLN